MKKIFYTTLLTLALALPVLAQAQTATLKVTITDQKSGAILPGTTMEIAPVSDTTQVKYHLSGQRGQIEVSGVAYGEYRVKFTFMGYKEITQNIRIDRAEVSLGTIAMEEDAIQISAAQAIGVAMRSSQRGDTLIYNASAFQVAQDASMETLLSKMPGIKIVDGEIEAQGETIQKILLDGKEFFGDDVSAAMQSIPAEVIKEVEVFNKLSDAAEFSGVEDADTYKALNIVTSVPITNSQFGRMYAGYGFDDKYVVGANLNFFRGEQRFTVMGLLNNINQFNFSTDDIVGAMSGGGGMSSQGGFMRSSGGGGLMRGGRSGISKIGSFALNYNGPLSKKVTLQANYSFGYTNTENQTDTERWYYSGRYYDGLSSSEMTNYQHRFNSRLDYKINEYNQIMWRQNVSFQNNENFSRGDNITMDSLDVGGGIKELLKIQDQTSTGNSKSDGFSTNGSLIYSVRLGKPGRTLVTDINYTMSRTDANSFPYSLVRNYNAGGQTGENLDYRHNDNLSKNWSLGGNIRYTEPIAEYSQLFLQADVTYRYSETDNKAYEWIAATEQFNPNYNEILSSISNNDYLTYRVGPGFNRTKNRNTIMVSLDYEKSTLQGNWTVPDRPTIKPSFDNISYMGLLNYYLPGNNTIRLMAMSRASNPSISQLQDVTTISSQVSASAGNPDLKQSYMHNVMANYIKTNIEKGRTLTLSIRYAYTKDAITQSTLMLKPGEEYILPNTGGEVLSNSGQFTQSINMDGSWNASLRVDYGFPLNFIRSNINVYADLSYNESPSSIGSLGSGNTIIGTRNITTGQYYTAGLEIGSNISQNIDFRVGYRGGYNLVENSASIYSSQTSEYFTHRINGNFKWVTWGGITLTGNATYTREKGVSDDYDEEFLIANLYLGKKLFKNQRGEISVGVNDLFDQNSGFSRSVTNTYIANSYSKTIGRYVLIQLVYNLRSYGTSGGRLNAPAAGPDGGPGGFRGPGGGGPPAGGPPPGGFGGRGGFGG